MKWFEGGIPDAVVTSQNNKAVFFVAIFGKRAYEAVTYLTAIVIAGDDDVSRQLEEQLETESVSAAVASPSDFVCVRLQANSDSHRAFTQLCAVAPSLYCIGPKAAAVDIIRPPITTETLLLRLQAALARHRQVLSDACASIFPAGTTEANVAATSSSQAQPKLTPANKVDNQVSGAESASPASPVQEPPQKKSRDEEEQMTPVNTETQDSREPSFEEKVRRARELALARQLQKQREEEEEQRRREMERRQAGKGAAELKRWQEEEETKRMLEERRKDREAEKALRQKLREQIAQDRAARNARSNADFMDQQPSTNSNVAKRPSVASASAMNYAGKARISFRLPDGGSRTYTFEPDATLGSVHQYLLDNGKLPFRSFTISIAFPRTKFESSQYSSTLRDLGLLPSAALLILPDTGGRGTSSVASYKVLWNLISALLGLAMLPISFVWSFAQRALPNPAAAARQPTSGSRNENQGNRLGTQTEARAESQSVSEKTTASQDSGPSSSKGKNSARKKLDGNVHRLRTSETDSDEEKATWNGNSTQQM